jgi:hypothetical protein
MAEKPRKPPQTELGSDPSDKLDRLVIFETPEDILDMAQAVDADGDGKFSPPELANAAIDLADTIKMSNKNELTLGDFLKRTLIEREVLSDAQVEERLVREGIEAHDRGDEKEMQDVLMKYGMQKGERALVEGDAEIATKLFTNSGKFYQGLSVLTQEGRDSMMNAQEPSDPKTFEALEKYDFENVEAPTLDDIAQAARDRPIPTRRR